MTDAPGEFLGLFREEVSDRLDNMVNCLLSLERGDDNTAETIDSLFREAHTIKGAAGMLDLKDVHDLAHVLEDLLSDVREAGVFPQRLADPLLRSIDTLRAQIAGENRPPGELISELTALHSEESPLAATVETPSQLSVPVTPNPGRSVRVPAEKIDRLLNLVGETALHRSRLQFVLSEAAERHPTLVDELDAGDRLLDDLKDTAIGMRTLPLRSIVGSFPRAVRDLALSENKRVELEMFGIETELDRTILETLPETLTHIFRNAVAHGIEDPKDRIRQDKPATGRITLTAEQRGSEVLITVSDDGRGVSPSLVNQAQNGGSLTDVLAKSGYSTAERVTELAGRGVGLDAVRASVESFGGRLEIHSDPGKRTAVTLVLPLALALLEVLLVERAGSAYGIPLSAVQEVLSIGEGLSLEGKESIDLRGKSVPVFDIADVIGADVALLERPTPAAVVAVGDYRAALACDRLVGQEDLVVKRLGMLRDVSGYVGGAILGDGRVALLLDLQAILRSPFRRSVPQVDAGPVEDTVRPTRKILVVEDFFTARELQKSILESAGYVVITADNGREALACLASEHDVDLVITDVEMPIMDGFALTEAIRKDERLHALPIVIVTSRDSAEDRLRGLTVGADAYMTKSGFNQRSLLESVEQLIGS